MTGQHHDKTYPGESSAYRSARDQLLQAELDLDAKVQDVAELRRALPQGGPLASDYEFSEIFGGAVRKVKLSSLFPDGKSTLLLYSFMYSEAMESPCPACTSLVDGFSNATKHIGDRMGLVLVGKSPASRLTALAGSRGWGDMRIVSSQGTNYNRDYFGETDDGNQIPAANIFVKSDTGIHHFWGSEMLYVQRPGHPRHVDQIWPIWNMLDLTPEGRGENWFPKLAYE